MRLSEAQRGFSLVEIMVAVVLLALCAVPAADAIKNGLDASTVAGDKGRELRCMRNLMESALAQPYQKLSSAALGPATPSVFSLARDSACPLTREVYISKYEHEYGKLPMFLPQPGVPRTEEQLNTALLYITVSSPDTHYTFTTLVAR